MVNNRIHATYTETYDLNTAVGELSMLGIHTPQAIALKKMFKGFFEQYQKYKILGCNFSMVCASQQALTPDLVGQESGKVDPRDVLNPILFKACTGESMNMLLDRIYDKESEVATGGGLNGSVAQHAYSGTAATGAYYQMLADDSFRKSHPQRGLTVTGLRPYVHKVVTTQPFKWTGYQGNSVFRSDLPSMGGLSTGTGPTSSDGIVGAGSPMEKEGGSINNGNPTVFVSDGITDMPWLETTVTRNADNFINSANPTQVLGKFTITNVPRVYCGIIVLPPAILQRLFFRLSIVWHIEFKDFRPAFEVGPVSESSDIIGPDYSGIVGSSSSVNTTYFNIYHNATSSKLPNEVSSFSTTEGTEVDTVLEKVA